MAKLIVNGFPSARVRELLPEAEIVIASANVQQARRDRTELAGAPLLGDAVNVRFERMAAPTRKHKVTMQILTLGFAPHYGGELESPRV